MEQSEIMPQRGIYLLPNLLTASALFAGFYAIVAAMKGLFDTAAIAIFIAMLLDGLDGRVARMTNTQTPFGAQFDSLSDMVCFGVAPALVMYSWSLGALGKMGWLVAFLQTAATALRLARFNTQVQDKRYFQGLSCTSAAGVIAGFVWIGASYDFNGFYMSLFAAAFNVIIACLMVSTIRYSSFKTLDFKGRVPFVTVVIFVFLITGVSLYPAEILFAIFAGYAASGPVITLWQLRKVKKQRRR